MQQSTHTRRGILTGAVTAALATGVAANAAAICMAPETTDPIKDAADVLGRMIQARHGGNWRVIVDHDTKVFLVVPRIEEGRS
jgi:hypothetical protein